MSRHAAALVEGVRGAILLALVVVASALAAEDLPLCHPRAGRAQCPPPAGIFQFTGSRSPYTAPVRFGYELEVQGEIHWVFLKAGPPPTPCKANPARAWEVRDCAAKIGDPLIVAQRFRVPR